MVVVVISVAAMILAVISKVQNLWRMNSVNTVMMMGWLTQASTDHKAGPSQ